MAYVVKNDDDLMVVGFVNDDKDVDSKYVVNQDEFFEALFGILKNSDDMSYLFNDEKGGN